MLCGDKVQGGEARDKEQITAEIKYQASIAPFG